MTSVASFPSVHIASVTPFQDIVKGVDTLNKTPYMGHSTYIISQAYKHIVGYEHVDLP
jgi:hypothetical protein